MNISIIPNGDLQMDLSLEELSWLGQALNECCGGFGVKDHETTLGAPESLVRQLLDKVVAAYPATLGSERNHANR